MAVALSLWLIPLAACGDAGGPGLFVPGQPGGGTSTVGGGAEALVGSWRNLTVIQVPGDLQTWTTTWRFNADGTCRQTAESESLSEGFPRITSRSCTYVTDGDEITVTYTGGGSVAYEFAFAEFSPDRLVLDGFEYQRLT